MKVLIACEESQRVCAAFRAKGHEAYSCDIIEPSGGHPEWHIRGNCLPLLNGNCYFDTMDGVIHKIDGPWDLLIAHPPCTYLCLSGQGWLNVERYGDTAVKRARSRDKAIEFFMEFTRTTCPRVAIENPVGCMTSHYRKPDQYIQPYQFGDACIKKTGLWLKGLKPLTPTKVVEPEFVITKTGKKLSKWFYDTSRLPSKARPGARSKTFIGIAQAMADQWG